MTKKICSRLQRLARERQWGKRGFGVGDGKEASREGPRRSVEKSSGLTTEYNKSSRILDALLRSRFGNLAVLPFLGRLTVANWRKLEREGI